jgi:hypothetical protein
MTHEMLLLLVCYCNLVFLMLLHCYRAVGLRSVITGTCKTKQKNRMLKVYVFWEMPLCRCPQHFRRFGEL